MKTTKKLFSLLLALVLTVALCAPAFAAQGETGSITINNAETNATYYAYKIFDMTYKDSSTVSYTYTKAENDQLYSALESCFTFTQIGSTNEYNATIKANVTAADIATMLHTNYETLSAQIDFVKAETVSGEAKFEDIAQGYYYITKGGESGTGSIVAIDSTDLNVEMFDKIINTPTGSDFTKNVIDESGAVLSDASYSVGERVKFQIVVPTANWAEQDGVTKQIEKYTVTDTMDSTLTYDKETLHVTIGMPDEVNPSVVTPIEDTDMTWVFTWVNDEGHSIYSNGVQITITYEAIVNATAAAAKGTTMNNTVHTKWTFVDGTTDDNPGPDPKIDPKTSGFTINKQDQKGNVVTGAEFKLYRAAESTTPGAVEKDVFDAEGTVTKKYVVEVGLMKADTYYRIALEGETVAEKIELDGTTGKAEIHGLKADTYYLEETHTPDGYNQLKALQTVTLTSAYNDNVKVVNNTGTVLPGTGGMGTTILTVVGLSIMVVAAVLLITKKRVEGKEED